jgi:hypothetical protein
MVFQNLDILVSHHLKFIIIKKCIWFKSMIQPLLYNICLKFSIDMPRYLIRLRLPLQITF